MESNAAVSLTRSKKYSVPGLIAARTLRLQQEMAEATKRAACSRLEPAEIFRYSERFLRKYEVMFDGIIHQGRN